MTISTRVYASNGRVPAKPSQNYGLWPRHLSVKHCNIGPRSRGLSGTSAVGGTARRHAGPWRQPGPLVRGHGQAPDETAGGCLLAGRLVAVAGGEPPPGGAVSARRRGGRVVAGSILVGDRVRAVACCGPAAAGCVPAAAGHVPAIASRVPAAAHAARRISAIGRGIPVVARLIHGVADGIPVLVDRVSAVAPCVSDVAGFCAGRTGAVLDVGRVVSIVAGRRPAAGSAPALASGVRCRTALALRR